MSTPLFPGHLEVLKLLVARGAELGCKDRKGYGLLHTAAAGGQVEAVKYLLRTGAEVRALSTGPGDYGQGVRGQSLLQRREGAGIVGVVWGGWEDVVRGSE